MVTVNPGSGPAERRRTWILGGSLLVASAFAQVAAQGEFAPLRSAVTMLFAAGALVLVIGIGRAGSVTARRPLGTGAVIGLVAVLVAQPFVISMLVSAEGDRSSLSGATSMAQVGTWVYFTATLMFALIGSVQIARIGVVPTPWNWSPLWALCIVALAQTISMAPFWSPLLEPVQDVSGLVGIFGVFGLVKPLATAALGIVAIVLGARTEHGSVPVFSSARS